MAVVSFQCKNVDFGEVKVVLGHIVANLRVKGWSDCVYASSGNCNIASIFPPSIFQKPGYFFPYKL